MPTESEAKIARYNTIEREADKSGHIIGVRQLRLSEKAKISGFTSDLAGFEEYLDPATGQTSRLPRAMNHFVAAAVCEIDGNPYPFARNRAELDAVLDKLDTEGIEAAIKALVRISDVQPAQPLDEAKNLSGTPPSA